MVAGRAQREHGRGDGAHARAEGQRVLGALEVGDRPPRTPARSGWRSGCRTRRRACPVARLRVSSRPSVCHVLVPHSGGVRLGPGARRPAVTARVAGPGWRARRSRGRRLVAVAGPSVDRPRSAGCERVERRRLTSARHGHHWCKRDRDGWGLGDRRGVGAAAGRRGAPRSSSPTCRRTRARRSPTRSAARSPRSTSPTPTTSSTPSRWPSRWARCACSSTRPASAGRSARSARTARYDSAANLDALQAGHRHQPDRQLRLHPHRRHGDEHRPSRSSTASGARSSTSPRSPRSTARSARPATRRRRAASSA